VAKGVRGDGWHLVRGAVRWHFVGIFHTENCELAYSPGYLKSGYAQRRRAGLAFGGVGGSGRRRPLLCFPPVGLICELGRW